MDSLTSGWQLQIPEKQLMSILKEMGIGLVSDGLLMPCTIFYIFILPLTRWYFDNGDHFGRHKIAWKKYMAAYNWAMCLFSFVIFALASLVLWDTPLYTEDCDLLFSKPLWPHLCRAFYWSKFIEYLDTFFHYVKGGPVSYLHWVHHIGASVNLWFLVVYQGEPGWIFVWLNSFIHVMMYWYYAKSLSKSGEDKCLESFKPVITLLQILQFLSGFYFLWQYPRTVKCFKRNAYQMIGVYYYTWAYVGLVLLLFLNFFLRTYLCRSKRSRKPQSDQISPDDLQRGAKPKENLKPKGSSRPKGSSKPKDQ